MTRYLVLLGAHAATGYLLAVGVPGALWGDSRWAAARGLLGWITLGGGAAALFRAFGGNGESTGSRHLMEVGAGAMIGALLLSFTLTPGYRLALAAAFLVGVLSAIPPARLASRQGWNAAVAAVVFGGLTPYAGFAATAKGLDLVSSLVLLGFAPLGATLYIVARASSSGPRGLALAVWTLALGFGFWLIAWLLHGDPWYVPAGALLGLGCLAAAFAAWIAALREWRRQPAGGVRSTVAWLLTDGAVVAAFAL